MGGGDPVHHRHRAVIGIPRRDRARFRPPSQPLSPHHHRGSGYTGQHARSISIARRTVVRIAAIGLVLADYPYRLRKTRTAAVAFAVGQEAAEARRPWR